MQHVTSSVSHLGATCAGKGWTLCKALLPAAIAWGTPARSDAQGHGMRSTRELVCICSGQLKRNSGGILKGHMELQHFQRQLVNDLHLEKKKKKRHADCAPLQKSSILLRSFTYYTGWTWQRFSKRLYWRAEQEPARLQKKCQPQKINTTLHHV